MIMAEILKKDDFRRVELLNLVTKKGGMKNLNLDQLGTRLRDGLVGICSELEIPVQVTGLGSLFGIHFTSGRVNSWRDVVVADVDLKKRVFLGMLNEGVMMSPELIGCVSAIMTADIVDLFLDRFDKVLRRNV